MGTGNANGTSPEADSYQPGTVTHGARRFENRGLLGDLDGRERETKLLKREVSDLIEERGGEAAVTVGERTLIERAAFKTVLCAIVETWVLQQATPMKDGALLPVLGKQYLAWSNSLRRDLEVLGLKPDKAKNAPALTDYLEQHADARSNAPVDDATDDTQAGASPEDDAHASDEAARPDDAIEGLS